MHILISCLPFLHFLLPVIWISPPSANGGISREINPLNDFQLFSRWTRMRSASEGWNFSATIKSVSLGSIKRWTYNNDSRSKFLITLQIKSFIMTLFYGEFPCPPLFFMLCFNSSKKFTQCRRFSYVMVIWIFYFTRWMKRVNKIRNARFFQSEM